MNREKIIIIDGNSLMNRAFYALPQLTNSKGIHTNAVYGFTNMILKILRDEKPDYIVATFDRKTPTFRHLEYAEYKAGRKKMPSELSEQFPIVKEILQAFKIGIYELDGYEADDIIGTIAKSCEEEMDVIIYTGDKDALQLISKNIKVAITKRGITDIDLCDEKTMMDKYGVTPIQFIDIKGLMGDASDNIPGVKGIGEKTAVKLITEFKSIENIIQNISSISSQKVRELMTTYAEQAMFSKKLATILTNVPIEFKLDEIKINDPDYQKSQSLFKELEFKRLIDKIPSSMGDKESDEEKSQLNLIDCTIAEKDDISKLIEDIKKTGLFSCVFDIKGSDFDNTDINGIAISVDGKNSIFIPPDNYFISLLGGIFENKDIKKICHNSKNGFVSLYKHGICLKGMKFDTAIASYLINPSENTYDVDELIRKFFNVDIPSRKDIDGALKIKSDERLIPKYLCTQAIYIYEMAEILREQLIKYDMLKLYNEVEHPLIEVLSYMEIDGFKVDSNMLKLLSKEFGNEINRLTLEIYNISGEEFNINSTKQLANILFDKLNLPVIKKTKTGYSTNAEVLEKLAPQHEIVQKILDFRQIMKLKSTYVDGLLNIIKEDNKIHSSFNQTITATGRISSTEPNLQNIPVRLEMGRKIRKVFIPSNDKYVILSADYSQIELRVLAHIAHDKNLIDAFYEKKDIHRKTASEVFNVPMDEVTSLMRSRAKAVNFGIVYGISDFGLSRDLGISIKEARIYIDNYLSKYSGVKKYMDDIIVQAKNNGYVTTILNRRRYIPEIASTNHNIRSLGERLAMNTPIQGSAADIIKIAMIKVYNILMEKNFKSRLILQVHDELILEVLKEELEQVKEIVKCEMENAIKLDVPLEIDINTGNNWFEAK